MINCLEYTVIIVASVQYINAEFEEGAPAGLRRVHHLRTRRICFQHAVEF